MSPAIVGLDATGSPEAWRAAGFTVQAGEGGEQAVAIGSVRVRIGDESGTGITGWTLAGIPEGMTALDGLPTHAGEAVGVPPVAHPNRATSIDHVVVWSVDDARTIDALVAAGFEVRRVREDARPVCGRPSSARVRSSSSWSRVPTASRRPTLSPRFFGIACTVADLDGCAALLGDALGPITDAVQPGRRIATLRGKAIGLEVPIAFMSADERLATA